MVKWSLRARTDLKAIHDFIAKDSPLNAQTVVREILRRVETMAEPAYLGRKVPEVNDERLREVSVHSWRILYHMRSSEIFIVTLVHKRRHLIGEDLTPLK